MTTEDLDGYVIRQITAKYSIYKFGQQTSLRQSKNPMFPFDHKKDGKIYKSVSDKMLEYLQETMRDYGLKEVWIP